MSHPGHRPTFCVHFDFLGGSDISKDDIFEFPFSTSKPRTFGVGGTSSILEAPLVDLLCWTSFGNVDLRGVKAVATLLADLRSVFRTSHDRFLAKYHSTDEATIHTLAYFWHGELIDLLPKTTTNTAQTIMAIIPPFEILIEPESGPAAPASESPDPAVEPASPAAGPSPGCCGAEVASAEKNEDTELADISGVNETKGVIAEGGEEVMELCAITCNEKKLSVKLREKRNVFMMRNAFNI